MNHRIMNWEYDWNVPIILGGRLATWKAKYDRQQLGFACSALALQQLLPRLESIGAIHE